MDVTLDSFIELCKIIVSPLVVSAFGLFINKRIKSLERKQWISQKVIEKRISIHDEVAHKINDLLCFYTYIGHWKEITPCEIIKTKRSLDKIFHTNIAFFSDNFMSRYHELMAYCFSTHTGWGQDAKIKSTTTHREKTQNWDPAWADMFCDQVHAKSAETKNIKDIKDAYELLISQFKTELGVTNH